MSTGGTDAGELAIEDLDLLLETMAGPDGMRGRAEALPLLCEKAADLLDCDATMLRLADADGAALRVVAVSNRTGVLTPVHLGIARGEVLALAEPGAHVVRRRSLAPSVDAFLTGEIQWNTNTSVRDVFPLATMCAAPLVRRGMSVGVIGLYWAQPHVPDATETRLIRVASRLAALVVEVTGATDLAAGALTAARAAAAERAAVAEALAAELERHGAARHLTAARPNALHVLAQPDAAAIAVADAEDVLGIGDDGEHQLVVADFADADAAFAQARTLADDPFLGRCAVAASGLRLWALPPSDADLGRLRTRLTGAAGLIGAGSAGPVRPGRFAEALRDAATAARLSGTRGGRLVAFAEVGSIVEATASIPEEQARALVREVLGPIEDYDRRHDARLLTTLTTYLSLNGSATGTARALSLHVNTVKQRLERIGRLLGADVRDYSLVARLLLALEWRSMLRD
ncbi:helix-turn-helix domain-containing protein [Microbacterium sp.]|uniref:helix-turn-helix domain-containing protein n=1 Tax=Microbacterium sp. TaxID=51671 RepID=UPI0039E36772